MPTSRIGGIRLRTEKETLINSSDLNIEYVSGQGGKTLRIDADNTYLSIIRCRAAYYTGTKPSAPVDDTLMAETAMVYKIPPIKAFVYTRMAILSVRE